MKNIPLKKLEDTSVFRKIAMGTWKTAKDPSVYGILEIDVTDTLLNLEEYSKLHDIKISPSHLVGKALAYCMKRRPEINGMIRGRRIWLRESVTLFYQVNIPGDGADKVSKATLSGCTVEDAQEKTLKQIAQTLKEKAELVRKFKDKDIAKNLNTFKYIPWWFSHIYLNIASFLLYGLNLNLSFLGLPRDPFGSVMITNVGSFGIDLAFAPLCPYTRVPLLLSVGAVSDKVLAVNGQPKIRKVLPIGVTFDHRLIDGVHASQMAKDFKDCFARSKELLFN
ncbi:2-oxo acid dehydrogenase subunit E2 [Halobacteriovorax sp. HLS]|uniref:2-oxo acid dehydrogenase subunit E2 n=1 Tax=Halobacteriovorax sp. HLS TaxID=2234000 RepID=UPI000FD7B05F|nr:2-oxo acid dehydrogenase subunit E2 [Halobacteriovorax sp. HLS]